jgi:threonine 3-dehydrogenase
MALRRVVPAAARAVAGGATPRRGFAAAPGAGGVRSPRVVVTGATGQIGMELIPYLRARYGAGAVLATDIRVPPPGMDDSGPYAYLDVTDAAAVHRAVVDHRADTVIHLASLLSAVGERNPALAMKVNARGSEAVLDVAAAHGARVFIPSTIAVFGPTTPRDNTPDPTITRPSTMYGVTKVYMELLGEYYAGKFGVDFRSLRYPGIISNKALPGGGTTDYAVEIYYEALKHGKYSCFLGPDTALPMMYMPDCIRGTVDLIEAPKESLKQRVYNMTAVSFTPAQLADSIKKVMPGFTISYAPDFRQKIADSWPRSIDDSPARRDWGWAHRFDTDAMTRDMLAELGKTVKPVAGKKA